MNEGATKSPIQIAALAIMLGGLILAFALATINIDLLQPPVSTILSVAVLAALLVHTLGMLINAIQNKRVGWAVGIFLFGPFASIIYFVAKYDTRNQTIGAPD